MREGWELKKLGDVCFKTSNINWKNNIDVTFNYIDLSAVSRDTLKVIDSLDINSTNAPSRAKKIIETNDVIFATTRPTLNRMAIIPSKYNNHICSTGFAVLRANQKVVLSEYIFYSLQEKSFMDRMEKMQRGASYPAVSDKDVKDFEIPIPPLPEQTQIVNTLDKAFKQIDQAKANLEKNLHNAKELFQSKLNEVFSQRGEGWEEKKLGDVCDGFQYGSSSKSEMEGDMPVLRMGNIKNGKIDWTNLKYSSNEEDNKKFLLKDGDVLFNRTNSPEHVGKSALYEGERVTIFAGYIIRLRGKNKVLNNTFLNFYLNSYKTRK